MEQNVLASHHDDLQKKYESVRRDDLIGSLTIQPRPLGSKPHGTLFRLYPDSDTDTHCEVASGPNRNPFVLTDGEAQNLIEKREAAQPGINELMFCFPVDIQNWRRSVDRMGSRNPGCCHTLSRRDGYEATVLLFDH